MKRVSADDLFRYVDWTSFMLRRYCFTAEKYSELCHYYARSVNCGK
jgi:hypothetical protein